MIKRSHALVAGSCALFGACHLVNGLDGYTFDGEGGAGGGGAGAGGGSGGIGGEGATFAVSVQVEQLSTALSLSLNGAETLPIDADGAHTFETRLADGATFSITFDDPSGEACVADTPTGMVAGEDVVVTVTCTPLVRPLFLDAPDWLDFTNAAGDGPCETSTATRYTDCAHGGERRAVYVPGADDCAGVGGVDMLGAFSWSCDDSGPHVQLVSAGLRAGVGLTSLIDFAAQSFSDNSVTITTPNGDITTEPASWWGNAFAVADGTTTHDQAGTIYLVLDDPLAGLTVDGDRVALVVDTATTITPAAGPSLTATGVDFVWLEGEVDRGVSISDTMFAVLRNARFRGDATFQSNTATLVHGVEIFDGTVCLDAGDNTGLAVEHAMFHGCNRPARFLNGTGGYLREVIAANCQTAVLIGTADGFAVDRVTLSGFAVAALLVQTSTGVHMTRVIAAATDGDAIRLDVSDSSLRGATAVLAAGRGFHLGGTGLWLSNLLAVNTGRGIDAENLTTRGRNWVSVRNHHAVEAINLEVSDSDVILDGVMKLGGSDTNCVVVNSTGIENGSSCLDADASTFTLSTPANPATNGIFEAKVNQDDSRNGSDTAGSAPYADDLDWLRFDSVTRGWGINGSTFPNIDHQGRCSPTNSDCRIWDWTLRSNNSVAYNQNGVPTGDDVGVVNGETFLINAIELLGDGVGDDDNLCESNEQCGFMPNIGGYQGHGVAIPGTFTGGAITGVTLYAYLQNGG